MSKHDNMNQHMREIAGALNNKFSRNDRSQIVFHAASVFGCATSAADEAQEQRDTGESDAQFIVDHADDIDHIASHFMELVVFLLAVEEVRQLS